MPVPRVLCVAEKPAIAKAVAQHLSGGAMQTVRSNGSDGLQRYCTNSVTALHPWQPICQELRLPVQFWRVLGNVLSHHDERPWTSDKS